jgi:hypothetical protein
MVAEAELFGVVAANSGVETARTSAAKLRDRLDRLRITRFSALFPCPFRFTAAIGGEEDTALEVLRSRLGRDAGALENHACGLADAVNGIGVVLHVKPVRPVLNDAGRRELLG